MIDHGSHARVPDERTENSLRVLALSMMMLLLLFPFFTEGTPRRILVNVFMSSVFLSAISAVSENRRQLLVALAIGVPWFVLTWVEIVTPVPSLGLVGAVSGLGIVFFSFTLWVVLDFVLRASHVTQGVLFGSVAIYLLLGGLWFILYALLERVNPGSFTDIVAGGQAVEWTELLYFSFVTLTTLGFGDIVPVTLMARHFAIAEAIAGVLYLPIVISRLVGVYIAQAGAAPSNPADLERTRSVPGSFS